MPIYKIYDEHLVSVIFEVEASSKEEAKSKFMKEDREIVYVGETDYEPTGNITIVVNKRGWWTMPVYDFLIRCTECNGEGEYQLSLNPSSPIYKCGYCSEGYVEVVESFDCEGDLRLDYPDAVDIIADETEEI